MTIDKIKVENMTSSNGNKVPNQFIIRTAEGTYFQSYQSLIAFKDFEGRTFLDSDKWDYSVTTGKYRNEFLGEGIAETRKKIKEGIYKLTELN